MMDTNVASTSRSNAVQMNVKTSEKQQQSYEVITENISSNPTLFRHWIFPNYLDIRTVPSRIHMQLRISNSDDLTEKQFPNPYRMFTSCDCLCDQNLYKNVIYEAIQTQKNLFKPSQTLYMDILKVKYLVKVLDEVKKTWDEYENKSEIMRWKLCGKETMFTEWELNLAEDCCYIQQLTKQKITIEIKISYLGFIGLCSQMKQIYAHMCNAQRCIDSLKPYVLKYAGETLSRMLIQKCGIIKKEFFKNPALNKCFQIEFDLIFSQFMTMGYVQSLSKKLNEIQCQLSPDGKPYSIDVHSIVVAILQLNSDTLCSERYISNNV